MIPGEYKVQPGQIALNVGRATRSIIVRIMATGRFRLARITILPRSTRR
ncbi:Urease subunit beta [Raoultella planticola]|uniref:Urease subunit beta n=1 Tax=Raoultella planticola TaxID=575 RepID=A0A485D9G0_RAOPL|nr:Urease subunit beta [Raoultella planticola]